MTKCHAWRGGILFGALNANPVLAAPRRSARLLIKAGLAFLTMLGGCVQVPPHNGAARVPLGHVTKLIKCDIYRTISLELYEHPQQRAQIIFLEDWAAKVHLTVYVDDTAAINPGATLMQPLAVAGTSYSTAIGGGLTTEAIRQEDIEFFISFAELGKEFKTLGEDGIRSQYDSCKKADGILLESDLGLKDLVDTALQPVLEGTLKRGNNLGPSTSAVASTLDAAKGNLDNFAAKVIPQKNFQINVSDFLKNNPDIVGRFSTLIKPLIENQPVESDPKKKQEAEDAAKQKLAGDLEKLTKLDRDARELEKNVVTQIYETLSPSLPKKCLDDSTGVGKTKILGITSEKDSAVLSASLVSIARLNGDGAPTPKDLDDALTSATKASSDAVTHAQNMIRDIKACLKNPPKEEKPLYDPLDVISQTVNFYITVSGSITPIWKLVRVTAPLSSTFASAMRKDTNTLILAMGRPDTKGGVASGPSAAMNQQIAASLLGQAVLTLPRP